MRRSHCSLGDKRAPGDTGVEFQNFNSFKRTLIVSSPQEGSVCVTVGCYVITFTSEEAIAIAEELLSVADSVQPPVEKDTEEEVTDG